MATIEQVKALMRMYFEDSVEKFKSVTLQIAAHEARIGYTASTREIKDLIRNPRYAVRRNLKLNFKRMEHFYEERLEKIKIY